VSVTIYRDNLALVTETRSVELPAGPVTLVLEDVADTLLPQSAVLGAMGRPIAESDYDGARRASTRDDRRRPAREAAAVGAARGRRARAS
jgi:hypothetical protein